MAAAAAPPQPPRLCIASCEELLAAGDGAATETYGLSGCDEVALYDALRARGVPHDVRAWDDGSVDWTRYALVVVRTTWDYSKSEAVAAAFRDWLARLDAAGVRMLNAPAVLRWNVNKRYLGELGVPSIPTEYVAAGAPHDGATDVAAIAARRGWAGRPLLLKPCVGGGSRGCLRVDAARGVTLDDGTAFLRAMTGGPGGGCDMMVQPYLPSVETLGELSVVVLGGAVSHAVVKAPLPGEYRTQEEHGGTPAGVPVTPYMRACAEGVLAAARRVVGGDAGALPVEALPIARVDFLRVPPPAAAGGDGSGAEGAAARAASATDVDTDGSTLLLLELEVIEPCLFFSCSRRSGGGDGAPPPAATRLVDLIVQALEAAAPGGA